MEKISIMSLPLKHFLNMICLIFVMFLVFSLWGKTAYGFTDHRFIVNKDGAGTLFIDSFPDEMNNIPEKNYPHFLICFCREFGKWDKRGILAGAQNCSNEKANSVAQKIILVMKALDKVIPNDEGIVAFSYILCYHDVVIYFEKDYSYDEMCVIAEKLNIERQNN